MVQLRRNFVAVTSKDANFVGAVIFLSLITTTTIQGESSSETTPLILEPSQKPTFKVIKSEMPVQLPYVSNDKVFPRKEELKMTTMSDSVKTVTRRESEAEKEALCKRFTEDVEVRENMWEFFSPGPGPDQLYPNNTTCVKTIVAPPKHHVVLDFRNEFHMEEAENCKFDFLEVRDGPHGYSTKIDSFCGTKHPQMITSSGRALWLRFTSDENIQYKGFHAVYSFVERKNADEPEPDNCVMYVNGSDGEITRNDINETRFLLSRSHNLPVDCMWIITAPVKWMIMLSFTEFVLKFPNECESNFIEIFTDETDLKFREKQFCGSIAESVNSASNILHVRYFAEARAINSTFTAIFTTFRKKETSKAQTCAEDEYDCEDNTCIDISLRCNGRKNCRFQWDESDSECKPPKTVLETIAESEHIIIILVVFCLILSGLCFAFLFNCTRKIIRDHRIIQEHLRQSRENELNSVGHKERQSAIQTSLQKITAISAHTRSRSNSSSGGSLPHQELMKNGIKHEISNEHSGSTPSKRRPPPGMEECYVPSGDIVPIFDGRKSKELRCRSTEMEPEEYDQDLDNPDDFSPMPEMKDSECQTRESLFATQLIDLNTNSDQSLTPPPPPPITRIPKTKPNDKKLTGKSKNNYNSNAPPFSTFGYTRNNENIRNRTGMYEDNNENARNRTGMYGDIRTQLSDEKRYRAEAVIEMEERKTEGDSSPSTEAFDSRPFSIDSTKSAPDVIVTH